MMCLGCRKQERLGQVGGSGQPCYMWELECKGVIRHSTPERLAGAGMPCFFNVFYKSWICDKTHQQDTPKKAGLKYMRRTGLSELVLMLLLF